jgi:hypothetical protein
MSSIAGVEPYKGEQRWRRCSVAAHKGTMQLDQALQQQHVSFKICFLAD